MGICDISPGQDVCEPFGSATFSHIDCHTSWDDFANFGELNAAGCGVGCITCFDYPSELQHHQTQSDGKRFLRPHRDLPSRDAGGLWHDLETGKPHAINRATSFYEAGSCFNQITGVECFNKHICRCWCGVGDCEDGHPRSSNAPCAGGEGGGEIMRGDFPDGTHWVGDGFPPEHFDCRSFLAPRNPKLVPMVTSRVGGLLMPVMPRTSQLQGNNCQPNLLTPCRSEVRGGDCPLSNFQNDPNRVGNPPTHYVENAGFRNLWDDLFFVNLSPGVRTATGMVGGDRRPEQPFGHEIEDLIRNLALQTLNTQAWGMAGTPGPFLFDRLGKNDFIRWRRAINHGLTGRGSIDNCNWSAIGDVPTVATIAVTTTDNQNLIIRCYVGAATIDLGMNLFRIKGPDGPIFEFHCRMHIFQELSWKIIQGGGGGGWSNPEDCTLLPEGPVGHFINWKWHDGKPFRPIRQVDWLGFAGHLGRGDEFDSIQTWGWGAGTLDLSCNEAAKSISHEGGTIHAVIHGFPTARGTEPNNTDLTYDGEVTIRFNTF